MAEFMLRAEAVLERRAELEAAEAHLKELGPNRKVRNAQMPGRYTSMDESDLETALLTVFPMFPTGRDDQLPQGLTVERARELRGFAEARAQEEASGNGVDRSAPFGTHAREQTRRVGGPPGPAGRGVGRGRAAVTGRSSRLCPLAVCTIECLTLPDRRD